MGLQPDTLHCGPFLLANDSRREEDCLLFFIKWYFLLSLSLNLLHEIWKETQRVWVTILSSSSHRGERDNDRRPSGGHSVGLWVSTQRVLVRVPLFSTNSSRHILSFD